MKPTNKEVVYKVINDLQNDKYRRSGCDMDGGYSYSNIDSEDYLETDGYNRVSWSDGHRYSLILTSEDSEIICDEMYKSRERVLKIGNWVT